MTIATIEPAGYAPAPTTDLELWARKLVAASQLGEALCRTSFVPGPFRGKPEEATAAVMYGDELGLSPMASLQNIFVISGKPSLYARTMHALVLAHGHEVVIVSRTVQAAVVRGRRKGTEAWIEETWTGERAHRAGYTSNAKYRTDPEAMLTARALADVCRLIAPDVLSGIAYTVEELEVIDPETTDEAPAPASGPERAREALALARDAKAPQDVTATPQPGEGGQVEPPKSVAPTVSPGEPPQPPAPAEPVDVVEALTGGADPEPPRMVSSRQRGAIFAAFADAGITTDARSAEGKAERLAYMTAVIGRPVESTNDLTWNEASAVIDSLKYDAEKILAESEDVEGGAE